MDGWIWIVAGVVAVVVVVLLVAGARRSKARRHELAERFGGEYERTVEEAGSRREGERELRARVEEHDELDLRPLSDAARERYARAWVELQARFVDRPQSAALEADDLVTQVLEERGYPVGDFDTKSRAVSVDQPEVVRNYRQGHDIALKARREDASTEELRQAVINYRALFDELVDEGGHGTPIAERPTAT